LFFCNTRTRGKCGHSSRCSLAHDMTKKKPVKVLLLQSVTGNYGPRQWLC
jgi:hypothetical protein